MFVGDILDHKTLLEIHWLDAENHDRFAGHYEGSFLEDKSRRI